MKKIAFGFAMAGLFAFTSSFACDWDPSNSSTKRGTCTGGGEGGGTYCEMEITPYFSCTIIVDTETEG